jgi:hypothetical protein
MSSSRRKRSFFRKSFQALIARGSEAETERSFPCPDHFNIEMNRDSPELIDDGRLGF